VTFIIPSRILVFKIDGTNPAPIPCNGWGPESLHSIPVIIQVQLHILSVLEMLFLSTSATPVKCPPVPTPDIR
jgi:hypothetical protein